MESSSVPTGPTSTNVVKPINVPWEKIFPSRRGPSINQHPFSTISVDLLHWLLPLFVATADKTQASDHSIGPLTNKLHDN